MLALPYSDGEGENTLDYHIVLLSTAERMWRDWSTFREHPVEGGDSDCDRYYGLVEKVGTERLHLKRN